MARTKKAKKRNRRGLSAPTIPERYSSGDRKPGKKGIACTPELLAHRRSRMPELDDSMLMTTRAGLPLEMLATARHITKAQREAGERYGLVVARWRAIKHVRDAHHQPKAGMGGDVDPVVAKRVSDEYIACRRAIENCLPITRAALDTVCVDEAPSRIMDHGKLGERLRHGLCLGLDMLCGVFRIREDGEKEDAA